MLSLYNKHWAMKMQKGHLELHLSTKTLECLEDNEVIVILHPSPKVLITSVPSTQERFQSPLCSFGPKILPSYNLFSWTPIFLYAVYCC